MPDRPVIAIPSPAGGWGRPWPDIAELAQVAPTTWRSLIGGADGAGACRRPRAPRRPTHRRRRRAGGGATVDVAIAPHPDASVVDVVCADHAAPRAREHLRGHEMVRVDGGTQALRRTVLMRLQTAGQAVEISVPDAFGALVLKAAAHMSDSRDPARHLTDAAVLLACVDPFADRAPSGSDQSRLQHLRRQLHDRHPAWLLLPTDARVDGQATLRILTRDT